MNDTSPKQLTMQNARILLVCLLVLLAPAFSPAQNDMMKRLEEIKKRQSQAAQESPGIRVKEKDEGEEPAEVGDPEESGAVMEEAPVVLAAVIPPYALTLKTLQERAEAQLGSMKGVLDDELFESKLNQLESDIAFEWIVNATLSQVARQKDFRVEREEMAEHLAELAKAAGHPGEPEKALAMFGIDFKTYIPELEQAILTEKLIFSEIDKQVSEKDMRQLFEGRKADFYTPRRVRLRAIVKDLGAARSDDELVKMIEDMERAQKKLRRGADFAEVAKEYSDAPLSAQKGGDMGWMTPQNALSEPFNKEIFNMVVGRNSDLLNSADGRFLYLFRVEEKEEEKIQPFENVQRELKFILYDDVKTMLYNEQRRNYSIFINTGGIPEKYMEKFNVDELKLF